MAEPERHAWKPTFWNRMRHPPSGTATRRCSSGTKSVSQVGRAIPVHRPSDRAWRPRWRRDKSIVLLRRRWDSFAMLVRFSRAVSGSTLATIRRRDGVVVELPGYDRKHRVPHDLAHVVAERELRLSGGVFGSIAGGAMFSSMRVVQGRPRHDAAERSKRLLRGNRRVLRLAEVMAGVVHDAVERGRGEEIGAQARRTWSSVSVDPFPWSERQLTEAVEQLTALTAEYQRTGEVEVSWPETLSAAVPSSPGIRRGRRGRH
jgi:hypothetical protein